MSKALYAPFQKSAILSGAKLRRGGYALNTARGFDMSDQVLLAAISFCGTLIGTLAGIVTSGRLTLYRISQLEKKVEKHNNLVERMVKVENSVKSAHHRIDEIRRETDE